MFLKVSFWKAFQRNSQFPKGFCRRICLLGTKKDSSGKGLSRPFLGIQVGLRFRSTSRFKGLRFSGCVRSGRLRTLEAIFCFGWFGLVS